jgi:2-oxo-3-hexenedioate decarboxylase
MSMEAETLADRVLAAAAAGRQIAPITDTDPEFDLASAYRVADLLRTRREAAGYRAVGRKIGFTNRTIWNTYGVHAPVWAHVYDRTVHHGAAEFDLSTLIEPRIEPEIVLRLARAPDPDMDDAALMACVGAVAHGFELVQSLFPGWRFRAPDTVVGFGMHGALVTGPFVDIPSSERAAWRSALAQLGLRLHCNGSLVARGRAPDVLGGGPLAALRHLVGVLAADPNARPLAPGEIVTTGTLTDAPPVAPGETWTTALDGLALDGLSLRLI